MAEGQASAGSPKIAFLLIHDEAHQVPHVAPIIADIARRPGAAAVSVFIRGRDSQAMLGRLLPPDIADRVDVRFSNDSWSAALLEKVIGSAAPLRRLAFLRRIAPELAGFDAIIVPESTSVRLKRRPDITARFIHTGHGALHRDRGAGFRPDLVDFDHLLVVGGKYEDRLLKTGVVEAGRYSIVGYPKFDAIEQTEARRRFFDNDNPTVVYNPHPHPRLSSWFRDGRQVLSFFADNPSWNLIFAPHTMLFRKKLHMTADLSAVNWLRRLPKRFENAKNIHVDLGSLASVDMTYTASGDVYLGDLSSQIFEFLYRPRPCIFLNSAGLDWRNDPNVAHWRVGQVIDGPDQLGAALDRVRANPDEFLDVQTETFEDIFGAHRNGGAARAADAILRVASA